LQSFANFRTAVQGNNAPEPELTPPASATEALPPVPESPSASQARPETQQRQAQQPMAAPQQKQAKRKKSFVATMFGRSGNTKSEYRSSLPAVVGD